MLCLTVWPKRLFWPTLYIWTLTVCISDCICHAQNLTVYANGKIVQCNCRACLWTITQSILCSFAIIKIQEWRKLPLLLWCRWLSAHSGEPRKCSLDAVISVRVKHCVYVFSWFADCQQSVHKSCVNKLRSPCLGGSVRSSSSRMTMMMINQFKLPGTATLGSDLWLYIFIAIFTAICLWEVVWTWRGCRYMSTMKN